jgi:hypothetical protein
MFPTKFINDEQFQVTTHNGIQWMTDKSKEETIGHTYENGCKSILSA